MPKFNVVFSRMIEQTISLEVEVPVDDDGMAEFAAREQLAAREHKEYVEWDTPQQSMTYERVTVERMGPLDWTVTPEDETRAIRQHLVRAYYEVVLSYLLQRIETEACNEITSAMRKIMTPAEIRAADRQVIGSQEYMEAAAAGR